MLCPRCHTKNDYQSNYCNHCGALLRADIRKRTVLRFTVVLLAAVGFFFIYNFLRSPEDKAPANMVFPGNQRSAVEPLSRLDQEPITGQSMGATGRSIIPELLVVEIHLFDIAGKTLSRHPAAVTGDGWVALPRWRILGGYRWVLNFGPGSRLELIEGVIDDLDDVGIWRVESNHRSSGPEIKPWQEDKAVYWHPVSDPDLRLPIEVTIEKDQRWFTRVSVSDTLVEDGVFVQQNHIVGWSFRENPLQGYMWRGSRGTDMIADTRVDDHYRLTFGGSREEEFVLALAMGPDYSDGEKLAALANAFTFEPRVPQNLVPGQWKTARLVSRMRVLVENLAKEGKVDMVANAFDGAILVAAADARLTAEVVYATLGAYGHEDAVLLVEDIVDRSANAGAAALNHIVGIQSQIYRDWVKSSIQTGELYRARQVFERAHSRLPQDSQITLLGVRLALEENDWEEAERLLQSILFQPELADQIRLLQNRIAELKSRENSIVVQFAPGSKHIPVTAVLSGGVQQVFIVDTGATMVTIPTSAAAEMGLTRLDQYPRRTVLTAGGRRQAPEVILPSITIDGWQVRDVKALVLDLPDQADIGLLGLNFLNRFQLDLNSDQGVLLLNPR